MDNSSKADTICLALHAYVNHVLLMAGIHCAADFHASDLICAQVCFTFSLLGASAQNLLVGLVVVVVGVCVYVCVCVCVWVGVCVCVSVCLCVCERELIMIA